MRLITDTTGKTYVEVIMIITGIVIVSVTFMMSFRMKH